MRRSNNSFVHSNWQKLTAFGFGLLFVILLLIFVLAVPDPTQTQWFVFRVVLALAAAGIGAVIPGLLVVHVSTFIRAGGAIALFVIVYNLNPPQLIAPKRVPVIEQHTGGNNSPAIVSGGDVTIISQPPEAAGKGKK